MGLLRLVTLTGADEKTSFAQMQRLSERFPLVEWAVLYSPERAGQGGRYPSLEWLERFAKKADKARMRVALHLCGKAVSLLLEEDLARPGLIKGDAERLLALAGLFDRVQVNTCAKKELVPQYRELVAVLSRGEKRSRVIFQWNERNKSVCEALAVRRERAFEVLVDASGGRGIAPQEWPALPELNYRRPGYAGGLGPHNILEQLPLLSALVNERMFWVDMESSLRDEKDCFDLAKCEDVLAKASQWELQQRKAAASLWGKGTRDVRKLEGLWLDWWVALATHRSSSVIVPPEDAVRTMVFLRSEGDYWGFTPGESSAEAARVLKDERIALVPSEADDSWTAYPVGKPELKASDDDMLIAGLRAVVLKHFGETVPKDMSEYL